MRHGVKQQYRLPGVQQWLQVVEPLAGRSATPGFHQHYQRIVLRVLQCLNQALRVKAAPALQAKALQQLVESSGTLGIV